MSVSISMFIKMLQYENNDDPEGIDINKTCASKEYMLCHYWYFKELVINLNCMFVINVTMY